MLNHNRSKKGIPLRFSLKLTDSSKADTITIAAIEAGVPALIEARNLTDRFRTMIRRKAKTELGPWIADARDSLFAPLPTES